MSPKIPANVFLKFFIVSSPSGPSSAAGSSPFSSAFSDLSLGKSGLLTADVALLVPETELVSDAAMDIRRI